MLGHSNRMFGCLGDLVVCVLVAATVAPGEQDVLNICVLLCVIL